MQRFFFVLVLCSVWNVSGLFALLFFSFLFSLICKFENAPGTLACERYWTFFWYCSLAASCFFMQLIQCWMTYISLSRCIYHFHVFNRTCDYFFFWISLAWWWSVYNTKKKTKTKLNSNICINLFHNHTQIDVFLFPSLNCKSFFRWQSHLKILNRIFWWIYFTIKTDRQTDE